MATGGIENMSDEIIHFKCCICNKKNIKTEAEKYCVQCQDYFCTSCADMHKMFLPSSIEHKVLDKGDFMTTGLATDLPNIPTQRCDEHPTKLADMFCKDHDEIICSSCVALKHRTCENIHSIPDEIDSLHQPAAYEDIKSQLQAVKKSIEDLKNAKEKLIPMLDQSKRKAVDDIKVFKKEMEAFLDKLEAGSINDVEERYLEIKANLKKEIDKVNEYSARLEQSAVQLRESVGNKAQEFICRILTETVNVRINFQEDSKLKDLHNDFKKLGQIIQGNEKLNQQRVTAYRVKSEKEISGNHPSDNRSTWIHGSCLISGWLLLCDNNNFTLKRVDMSTGLMKDVLHLEVPVCDVCVTKEEADIAVSTSRKFIQFVNIGDKMVATKQLKFDHNVFGIACKNNQLFLSDAAKSFYIYDMTGKLLHLVENDNLGNLLFSTTRHLTICDDMVYIADNDKGLIALDINGSYKFTFTDPKLRRTQCVCSDRRGNLLVGGFDSTEMFQINEASQKVIGVFGKVRHALSACFDPQHNKLIVTESGNDKIKVYELI